MHSMQSADTFFLKFDVQKLVAYYIRLHIILGKIRYKLNFNNLFCIFQPTRILRGFEESSESEDELMENNDVNSGEQDQK